MKHRLSAGTAMIDALSDIGASLSYEVRNEHRVGRGSDIDVSWTAAGQNDVPLFIFEVESAPTAGLANNAQKVYGRSRDELVKPLFFFHIVMAGRPGNERIIAAQRAWGQHNYRVYRANDREDRESLLGDILRQHRRVQRLLEVHDLLEALDAHPDVWGDISRPRVLHLAEQLEFRGYYLRDYTRWALRDNEGLSMLASRIAALEENQRVAGDELGFTQGLGAHSYGGMLEVAARLLAGNLTDEGGPRAFERWAIGSGLGMRMIGPYFGLDRDYDRFIMGFAGREYAIAAGALDDYPRSRDWLVGDLRKLLLGMGQAGLPHELRAPTAIWLAHMVAATSPEDLRGSTNTEFTVEDLDEFFKAASEAVGLAGGATVSQLLDPPYGGGEGVRGLLDDFAPGGAALRDRHWLRSLISGGATAEVQTLPTRGGLVLATLLDEAWLTRSNEILANLYQRSPKEDGETADG